jgi:hypothetical protein
MEFYRHLYGFEVRSKTLKTLSPFLCKKFKVPMKRKLFMCIYKICCLIYTIPKFETFRAKIDDFTNPQSCAILPQEWSEEWVELSPK